VHLLLILLLSVFHFCYNIDNQAGAGALGAATTIYYLSLGDARHERKGDWIGSFLLPAKQTPQAFPMLR
jgi:hypothetical protein